MKDIDILIISRPDHSVQIYRGLLNQSRIKFLWYTFKVFKERYIGLIPLKKAIYVNRFCKTNFLATLISFIRARRRVALLEKYSDKYIMNKGAENVLRRVKPKIVHYWPLYSSDAVIAYKKSHPNVITLAEAYCPNPAFLKKEIQPILEKQNLPSDYLNDYRILDYLKLVDTIVVPSEYVAETYRYSLPDKKYVIIPYGITIWPDYAKKIIPDKITKFVYAGTISVEKGCDILLNIFSKHPELELHLYGNFAYKQEQIFQEFKSLTNVHFHGSVAKAILQNELSKYDVGIHLSRFDAYSLSVGEMIGCGIPVIISDQTGNAGLVRNYGLGIVTSLDETKILDALYKLCSRIDYKNFVENIDKYINSDPNSYGRSIVSYYNELLNGL